MFIYANIVDHSEDSRIPVDKILHWRKGETSNEVVVTMTNNTQLVVRADLDKFDQAYQSAVAGSPAQADRGY